MTHHQENSVGEIWAAAIKISSGYGFWGSVELYESHKPKVLVTLFIEELRKKGYQDFEIVLFGDSKSGRHIANQIMGIDTIDQFVKIVKKYSPRVDELDEYMDGYRDSEIHRLRALLGSQVIPGGRRMTRKEDE